MRLEGGLFLTDEFVAFAKDHVMFLSIMSRVPARKDDALLRAYGFRGFPSMAVLSPGLGKLSSPRGRSVEAFKAAVSQAKAMIADDPDGVAAKDKAAEAAIKQSNKKRAFLGVRGAGASKEAKGVAINVIEGKAASKAGLQDGDSIYEVDGNAVSTLQELAKYLGTRSVGDEVTLKLLRGGEDLTIKVKLGTE